jgi:oligoribonuclease (3'-5' exoribonuclease)
VVHQSDAVLDAMDNWNKGTHGKSGLIDKVKASTLDEASVEAAHARLHETARGRRHPPMCGNSICQDRRFMARHLPAGGLFPLPQPGCVDPEGTGQALETGIMEGFKKANNHTALADIRESIEEMKYYREHFIRASTERAMVQGRPGRGTSTETSRTSRYPLTMKPGTPFYVEVNPRIRAAWCACRAGGQPLVRWDRPTRTLFARLHPGLWDAVGHNPKAFLKRVDEERLIEAAEDHIFVGSYNRVLSAFDTYMSEPLSRDIRRGDEARRPDRLLLRRVRLPREAFRSIPAAWASSPATIARRPRTCACPSSPSACSIGRAISPSASTTTATRSPLIPIPISTTCPSSRRAARTARRSHIHIELPGRKVEVKVWEARIGHVRLYLLDTDLPENRAEDRDITHQLYGGDRHTRIQQEIVLGVGGMRALEALGIKPSVLPHQRRPRRLPGARTGAPQGEGQGCRSPPPWRRWRRTPCSPRTPRCRPATTISARR